MVGGDGQSVDGTPICWIKTPLWPRFPILSTCRLVTRVNLCLPGPQERVAGARLEVG